jgi:two-component system, OmpR family, phosphate regulon response regulator PhoB
MGSVLVVDDDADLGAVLVELLEARGIRARAVMTVDQALVSLDEHPPELVVLDWFLPDRPPHEVAARCHELHIPIVLSSAASDSDVVAREIAAAAILPKPFDVDAFYQIIDRLLRPRAQPSV